MGIKRYIFLMAIVIAVCGIYVYTFENSTYTLEFFGIPVTLQVALWITLPMVLVMVLSVAHMMFYGMKNYMTNRALGKDRENFISYSKSVLLGEESDVKFKTEWFKLPKEILQAVKNPVIGKSVLEDDDLKKVCEDISSVYDDGEYVNLKSYRLTDENPLNIKNKINQLDKEPKIASDVLRNCKDSESELCQKALNTLINNASYTEISKLNLPLTPLHVKTIVKRSIDKENELFMSEEQLDELLNSVQMSDNQYLEIARMLKKDMNPDALVAMFEKIYHKEAAAGKAYLYILFELQMLDKAREVLASSEDSEYSNFKTYLFLRENNKNADINIFL